MRARARAVRFRNETQLRDRERTAVWGFLCEHRANPTALNAVRSAPVRRAHVCGVVTGACFPRPAPVSGAGRVPRDTTAALRLAARPILRPVRKLEARPRFYAVSALSSTAPSSSQFAEIGARRPGRMRAANVTSLTLGRPDGPSASGRTRADRRDAADRGFGGRRIRDLFGVRYRYMMHHGVA